MGIQLTKSFLDFSPQEWNLLTSPHDPFSELEFLQALETSGCIGESTTWKPRILYSRSKEGILEFVLPFYEKYDSYGEYIFDFQWADALQRAGLSYYPKLLVSTPFTPATGNKFLIHPNLDKNDSISSLIGEVLNILEEFDFSSVHTLFVSPEESEILTSLGLEQRLSVQYHWINRGYRDFSDFTSALVKKRRKSILKERKNIASSGIEISILPPEKVNQEDWKWIWRFYQSTTSKKWGQAYLNAAFFQKIFETFRHRIVLVLAKRNGVPIAGTINFHKGDCLYGRYWGSTEFVEALHFECCYYSLIDYALSYGIQKIEAGAQGEHKFLRGFEMVPIYSHHRFLHPQAQSSIAGFLDRERKLVTQSIQEGNLHSPLKLFRTDEES